MTFEPTATQEKVFDLYRQGCAPSLIEKRLGIKPGEQLRIVRMMEKAIEPPLIETPNPRGATIAKVWAVIQTRDTEFTTADIAAVTGISVGNLSKLFRALEDQQLVTCLVRGRPSLYVKRGAE